MRRIFAGFAFAIVAALPALAAQDTTSVAPGDAVKVTAPSRGLTEWQGTFVRLHGDTVVLRGKGADTALSMLPIPAITEFEVNHGNQKSHGHWLAGALIGAGTGLIAGLVIPVGAGCANDPYCDLSANISKGAQVLMTTAVGGLLGAGIGALIRTDPYKPVKLQPSVGVMSLPQGRVGIGIQARFR